MTDERWERLIEDLQKAGQVTVANEPLLQKKSDGMVEEVGTEDSIVFKQGSETYKIVRENRPVVLGKKMMYSHRQGDTARTEYTLSDTELSHKIHVYREVDYDEWEEIGADNLGL